MNKGEARSIYFIGIGGIGISALARFYKAKGWKVSGSDIAPSKLISMLRKEGIRITVGHRRGNIKPGTGLVVYNRAIHQDNPEIVAAKKFHIKALPYAEVLGKLTEEYTTIAITGVHGKSTTTALAALTLMKGGYDPTVLVGTTLKEFGDKNIHVGKSNYLVIEADDFGAAFTAYSPTVAIVTNIDQEHLDFYKNFNNIKKAFLEFLSRVKPGGLMILNRDNAPLWTLHSPINVLAWKKNVTIAWYSATGMMAKKIKKIISISGKHNVSNAAAVLELGRFLEIPEKTILSAIHNYHGAWRRMELRGKFKGALVFDDYAHHPTEIAATLQAFREKFPKKTILCVFEPHQVQRTAILFKEFQTAFDGADETLILPIYHVAGRDAVIPNRDSEALVRTIQKKQPHKPIFYLANPKQLKNAVVALGGAPLSKKVIVMMGAGDIVKWTDSLLK